MSLNSLLVGSLFVFSTWFGTNPEARAESCGPLNAFNINQIQTLAVTSTRSANALSHAAASDLACLHDLTAFDKEVLKSFQREASTISESAVDQLISKKMKLLSPQGQVALIATAAQARAQLLMTALSNKNVRNAFDRYQHNVKSLMEYNIRGDVTSHFAWAALGPAPLLVATYFTSTESPEYMKRLNATSPDEVVLAVQNSTLSEAQKKDLIKSIQRAQSAVVAAKQDETARVIAGIEVAYGATKTVAIAGAAASLSIGAVLTCGALGPVAAAASTTTGSALVGTLTYIAGSGAVGAMGGAGAAGMYETGKVVYDSAIKSLDSGDSSLAGYGCSLAREIQAKSPEIATNMIHGAVVGGIIGVTAAGIPVAAIGGLQAAGMSGVAATTTVRVGMQTAMVAIGGSQTVSQINAARADLKESERLREASISARDHGNGDLGDQLENQANLKLGDAGFGGAKAVVTAAGTVVAATKVAPTITEDLKTIRFAAMTPREFRSYLVKNGLLKSPLSPEQLSEMSTGQRAAYATLLIQEKLGNGQFPTEMKPRTWRALLERVHRITPADGVGKDGGRPGFYFDSKKNRFRSNYPNRIIALKRQALLAAGLSLKAANLLLDMGVCGDALSSTLEFPLTMATPPENPDSARAELEKFSDKIGDPLEQGTELTRRPPFTTSSPASIRIIGTGTQGSVYRVIPKNGSPSYVLKSYSSSDLMDADLARIDVLKTVATGHPNEPIRLVGARVHYGQTMRLDDVHGIELASLVENPSISAEARSSLIQLYQNKMNQFITNFIQKYPTAEISFMSDPRTTEMQWVHILIKDPVTRVITQFNLKPQNIIVGRDLSLTLIDPW